MTIANTLPTSINQSYIIQSTYSSTLRSFFNSSWNDVDQDNATLTVKLESNYTGTPANYTANNITKGIYNYSAILPAGTITRRWCATDSASAVNCTDLETFTISKAASNITLLLDNTAANLSVTTGANVNITVNLTAGVGFAELYNTGTFIAKSSRFPYSNLSTFSSAGTFNITAFIFADQNSSFNFTTLYVTATAAPAEEPSGGGGEVTPPVVPPVVPPEVPPVEEPPEEEVPPEEETPPEQLPEELEGISITAETPSVYSSSKENNSIVTTVDNFSKLSITFDIVFEDGKPKAKPTINLDFELMEECVGCLKEESPKVIYPVWLWVLLVLLIALLLLAREESSYEEESYRRRLLPLRFVLQTKIKKSLEVLGYFAYAFITIPYYLIKSILFTITDSIFYVSDALYYLYKKSLAIIRTLFIKRELPTYDYLKKSASSIVRDIKDIFTLSDELVKDSYMRLKYYELVGNLKNEANKVAYEVQYGDYKRIEQKLKEIKFSFYKIPRAIRGQEKQFGGQLAKLEHSVEIGFLVDQAIRCLERKRFNKAQRLLDRISHYAFIPEGVISNKYFNCIRYYEHFLYRQQYSASLNKVNILLTKKRLKQAIIHYGRFVDISKKLSWYEDAEGKQELYNNLDLLHEKLHVLFLRQSAEEKARELKVIQVQFAKITFPRIDFALPPDIIHFNERLEKAYKLIKTKDTKKASIGYYELVEFYNSLEGISKKESNWMFSNLIKLKHCIVSGELLDSIKDIKPVARIEIEETKAKLGQPGLSRISTRLYSHYIRLKNSLNLKGLYERAHASLNKVKPKPVELIRAKLPEEHKEFLIKKYQRLLHELEENTELEELRKKAHKEVEKVKPRPIEIPKVELPDEDKSNLLKKQHRALDEIKTSSELQELKQRATEKIKKVKSSEIKLEEIKQEIELVKPVVKESTREFNSKLSSIYKAIKENKLSLARRHYENAIRFYNELTEADPKILSKMYSELIRLRSELEAKLIKKRLRNVK